MVRPDWQLRHCRKHSVINICTLALGKSEFAYMYIDVCYHEKCIKVKFQCELLNKKQFVMRSIEDMQVNGQNKNNTNVSHIVHNIQNNPYVHTLHVNNDQYTRIFSTTQGINVVIMFGLTPCMHSPDNFLALLMVD